MSIVSELLDQKGRNVWTISADSSVYDAVVLMSEMNIGALIVTSDSSKLAGIISERDYARSVVINDKSSKATLVSEIMTEEVVSAKESTLLDRCMSLMAQKKIRHLPIVDRQGPVGMITVGDIMKTIIEEQSMTIEELETFMFVDEGGEG
ncbi:MAG: CBS domain-containing protein [Gammaproteobacteria bacterium]|mgnify:FL=1|jgi:CBS domain-containing protein|nr:CBS domain-containing protein [Gammaproteobacteria bacterium]MBT3867045.1 CBS domain-containing protein [Gammaproteobacteria bacterium]MBT4617412.1 CBS domain-containing protein [Gammaproteobacteria bacterium]MBT5196506.1 CBS domain-containing protein [Gammaproteobacteria bacterium]MBT5441831.1 CBS domain-containing protein [Gammaproteobacteria bacterium]